jgi:hypothetical protein
MTTQSTRKWISIPQAARELDCSQTRIRRILVAGGVSVLRIPGTQPRVNTLDLAQYISSHTAPFRSPGPAA